VDICRIGMGTHAGKVVCALAAVLLLGSFSLAGQKSQSTSKANAAGSFDTPVKKVTVDLGRSPYSPENDIRNTLSCFYFPNLLIKQYDQGQVGAEWLSILRSREKLPACKLAHEPEERVVKWQGYFWGVKGNLVFFDGGEVQQVMYSFAVFNATTLKKLFEDDVSLSPEDQTVQMQVFSTKAGVVAKYLAATNAGCDLYAKGTDCWNKVKAKFGLKSDHKPVCTGYPFVYKLFKTDEDESMIGYPVEVTFSPHPTVKTVAGPIKCWASI
jgi:hypothetical protein